MSDWVTCPICGESDMRKEMEDEDAPLIYCVNHACVSNGGDNADALLLRLERQKSTAPFVVGERVEKVKGYRFVGRVIMAGVVSDTGEPATWRFGIRNGDGIIHIFSARDLRKADG